MIHSHFQTVFHHLRCHLKYNICPLADHVIQHLLRAFLRHIIDTDGLHLIWERLFQIIAPKVMRINPVGCIR